MSSFVRWWLMNVLLSGLTRAMKSSSDSSNCARSGSLSPNASLMSSRAHSTSASDCGLSVMRWKSPL